MAGYQQLQIWIGNYRGWTNFLWVKTLMISMKRIQVGMVRLIIEKFIPLKTVVCLSIRRQDRLLRVDKYTSISSYVRGKATGLNATL